ncbi:hypothetical protein B9Z19DRAFT_597728 [Tuber borchii]|uniref:Transmembrane protein n=1 Tax=Tuber borchii TaxID=42251 RepID=A0A2T6ZBU2_TUBBO|nr:hypothetical protein B9Z19DRAFT_597728 [Tuber borchii]
MTIDQVKVKLWGKGALAILLCFSFCLVGYGVFLGGFSFIIIKTSSCGRRRNLSSNCSVVRGFFFLFFFFFFSLFLFLALPSVLFLGLAGFRVLFSSAGVVTDVTKWGLGGGLRRMIPSIDSSGSY